MYDSKRNFSYCVYYHFVYRRSRRQSLCRIHQGEDPTAEVPTEALFTAVPPVAPDPIAAGRECPAPILQARTGMCTTGGTALFITTVQRR